MNPRPRPLTAVLRQIAPGGIASVEFYTLPVDGSVVLGRDPVCQIVLDSHSYKGVSRQHAQIRAFLDQDKAAWQVCDLNSSNGTYVNGCLIQGEEQLHEGDRISLGKRGPQFMFELLDLNMAPEAGQEESMLPPVSSASTAPNEPSGTHSFSPDSSIESYVYQPASSGDVTFSQLFPIISTGRDLTAKAYLIPGVVTVLFVVLMFIAVGNVQAFNTLIAAYLSAAAYYFVYQLCGKHKPAWLLLSSGMMTALVLKSPLLDAFIFVFQERLPGAIPTDPSSVGVISLFIRMLFGAGLMEELIKALPILGAWVLGRSARSARYRNAGVNEPLDGILIGAASAVGFTLIETHLYIAEVLNGVMLQDPLGNKELMGLQLLIPRILGSVSGHMAYSGYLGYFIGLSTLKSQRQWQVVLIGYISASVLHALWNTTGFVNPLILALIGVLSYAFLAAAILKARALSPTRSNNFATRFTPWGNK
ncbi:MAG: PrsW family glutamic-type intramembrane protease [Cyanobacteria bacterium P01_F01_bin.150]